ncbi:MAG: hypothetical protein R8K54_06130, partial [Mariprofundaceae bacterium]
VARCLSWLMEGQYRQDIHRSDASMRAVRYAKGVYSSGFMVMLGNSSPFPPPFSWLPTTAWMQEVEQRMEQLPKQV